MTTSPKTLRNRNLTAAKRSLKLILDELEKHQTALENGEIPEVSIAASLVKYETGLIVLRTLDALGKDYVEARSQESSDGEVSVSRDGLAALIELLRASDVGYVIHDAEEGSVLDSIVALVGTGEPAEQPS
jgi:hypothetical protein